MDNWMHSSFDKSYAFRYFYKIRLNRFWLKKFSCKFFVKTTIWKSIPRRSLYKSMYVAAEAVHILLFECLMSWNERIFSFFIDVFTLILDVKCHSNWKIITKYLSQIFWLVSNRVAYCYYFSLQSKAPGRILFDQACKQLSLLEIDYFGLEYQDGHGVTVRNFSIPQIYRHNI